MLGALYYFGTVLNGHYAIRDWLFWKYAKCWLWLGLWLGGCGATGLAIVERLVPGLPLRERAVQSFAVGVYAYYLLQFTGGILHLFGAVWAVGLPALMFAFGAWDRRESLQRVWRHRHSARRLVTFRMAWWQAPIALFGLSAIVLLYYAILTPQNIAFDSEWYHLGLPQGWAAAGGITRTPEGFYYEAIPNLAAVLYSYAFTLPRLDLFEIVALSAHMEFALFLATLASIPVLVRWLVPRSRAGVAWVAIFLFPSVYIYDASLHSGNDHVAAFFAIPTYLALRRAWKHLASGPSALLAICAAGAVMTKYQAMNVVVGPAIFIVARAVQLWLRKEGRRAWRGPLVALAVSLAITSPLWAKNFVWYGDPFYPALHKHLTGRPTNPDQAAMIEWSWKKQVNRPEGTRAEVLKETLVSGFDHSFRSFSSATRFHGAWPYFGSLFVLSMAWLPFLRGTRRTWGLVLSAQLGVFTWYYMSFVERYLQVLVPCMAAAVAASLALAWRHGWPARIPAALLVLLQVVWGGDAYFFPSHAMSKHALTHTMTLMASGFTKDLELHEKVNGSLEDVGKALPKGAHVLLHEYNPRLGLRSQVVTDMAGFQALIRYGRMNSMQDVHELYQSIGITHLVWRRRNSSAWDSMAGDLRFFEFALNAVGDTRSAGSMEFGRMLDAASVPAPIGDNLVVYAGCNRDFAPGLYHLADMHLISREGRTDLSQHRGFAPLPATGDEARALLARAEFVVYGKPSCRGAVPYSPAGFIHAATREKEELWVRDYRRSGG